MVVTAGSISTARLILDTLNSSKNDEQDILANGTTTGNIHIAFIGDSRIRQIFADVIQNPGTNFINVISKLDAFFSLNFTIGI